jgi:hypothetical protein
MSNTYPKPSIYAPYDKMPEFAQGYADYMAGKAPAFDIPGVAGQAYDRGANYAMKVETWRRMNGGCENFEILNARRTEAQG